VAQLKPVRLASVPLESPAAIDTESIVDPALHHEIKCRAYDLYKRHGNPVDGRDSHDELPSELPRVAYAAAHLQMYLEGEVGDTQSRRSGTKHRFVAQHEHVERPSSALVSGINPKSYGNIIPFFRQDLGELHPACFLVVLVLVTRTARRFNHLLLFFFVSCFLLARLHVDHA
jgi:hypothetical protein